MVLVVGLFNEAKSSHCEKNTKCAIRGKWLRVGHGSICTFLLN